MATAGNADSELSPFYKVWIKQGDLAVVAALAEGSEKAVGINWTSPFEGADVADQATKGAALIQDGFGVALRGNMASIQAFGGARPHTFTLTLQFYALHDPATEVTAALRALEMMALPELHEVMPTGRPPAPVEINIGTKYIVTECVIESISEPMYGVRDPSGNLLSCQVSVTLQTKTSVNTSDVPGFYK